jgi:soluble P-type ATPase
MEISIMIQLNIPENADAVIKNVVFDMNGTIAEDGIIRDSVIQLLNELSKKVNIHIITSDTFGTASEAVKDLIKCKLYIIKGKNSAEKKKDIVYKLGYSETVVIGNGHNDYAMFKQGFIGIGIMGEEGLSLKAALHCDIIIGKIEDAINLLLKPKRLIATLRY